MEKTRLTVAHDPVCGMDFEHSQVHFHSRYKGVTHHFCSSDCKQTFDLFPEKFIAEEKAAGFEGDNLSSEVGHSGHCH